MRAAPLTLTAVATLVIGIGAYLYWQHAERYPSTDDAYINANVVRVAPLVDGRVIAVEVRNQQHVNKGDPLFEVDPEPFRIAVRQAEAQLELAKQNTGAAFGELRAAEAEIRNRQVLLQNAEANANRTERLVKQGFISHQASDDANAALKSASAELASARAKAFQAKMSYGSPGEENERVKEAAATLDKARLDLQHTRIQAPCSGSVAELSLHPGDTVKANTPVFAVICERDFWVDANFKETQLGRIHSGQPVTIDVDMYPGHVFHGKVENIGGATGVAFSLLPPQNATGNWVKVTQRIPVRMLVTDHDPNFPLRVGASATVTVDTTGTR
jgi:membrane fusion protein (multidrug efflux system)